MEAKGGGGFGRPGVSEGLLRPISPIVAVWVFGRPGVSEGLLRPISPIVA
jgi:hypothetical protein